MRTIDDQAELALARAPRPSDVSIDFIRSRKNGGSAFTLACDASGLDDKEIYLALNIDAGYFSNIKKGKATLQADLISAFCTVVGNTVYAEWIAYQLGCTLMMLRSEAERRADELRRQLDEERLKNRVLVEAMHGRISA